MKRTKRPVSNIFIKADGGSVKNKNDRRSHQPLPGSSPPAPLVSATSASSLLSSSPGTSSPLANAMAASAATAASETGTHASSKEHESPVPPPSSASPSTPPPTNLLRRMSLIEVHIMVQTKDRSEWLNRDVTLKDQGIEVFDSLLLVRQEKILSFYDRLEEDPKGVYSRLTEQADTLLQQLQSMTSEIDQIKSGVMMFTGKRDVLKAQVDHRGEDDLTTMAGDEVEVIKRDGDRWFGRNLTLGGEGFFPSFILTSPGRMSSADLSLAQSRTLSRSTISLASTGENPVRMEGYLSKKGKTFDHWKKKYYRLRNHNMWYYKSDNLDEKAVGHFSVLNAKISTVPNYKKKAHTFAIVVDGAERFLSAPSHDVMEKWVAAVNMEKSSNYDDIGDF